jgi:hypothetical protein
MESDCDHVTSDMGLGLDGCKFAALRADCSSLTGVGSLDGSRNNGRVLDHNGMAGAASDEDLDKSRNGGKLSTGGAVSTAGGKLASLEHATGTGSSAKLNPIDPSPGTVVAGGS